MSAIARLGALLSAEEAGRIAAELRQRRLAHLAAKRAYPEHQLEVKRLLAELLVGHSDVLTAAAVLDGIAAVPRVARPDLVWTSPRVPGAEGRTTLAALGAFRAKKGRTCHPSPEQGMDAATMEADAELLLNPRGLSPKRALGSLAACRELSA